MGWAVMGTRERSGALSHLKEICLRQCSLQSILRGRQSLMGILNLHTRNGGPLWILQKTHVQQVTLLKASLVWRNQQVQSRFLEGFSNPCPSFSNCTYRALHLSPTRHPDTFHIILPVPCCSSLKPPFPWFPVSGVTLCCMLPI